MLVSSYLYSGVVYVRISKTVNNCQKKSLIGVKYSYKTLHNSNIVRNIIVVNCNLKLTSILIDINMSSVLAEY